MTSLIEQLKEIPSPLIVEGARASDILEQLNRRALCKTQNACGQCASCVKVAKGFHPDLLSLKEYDMEAIREALQKLQQRPYEAAYRVLSLFDFEMAQPAVQNALLKTIEEPSARWKIWLGTKSKMALLPTIRSRCLVIQAPERSFQALDEQDSKIFDCITNKDEWSLTPFLENLLKDREKARARFIKLLSHASQSKYPGHWKALAPSMENALSDLSRNLNPKIVWENIWSQSLNA